LPYLQAWIAGACGGADGAKGTETGYPSPGRPQDQALGSQSAGQAAPTVDAGGRSRLGRVYFDGRGVSQEDAQAVTRLRIAAEQGATLAQCGLGKRYADGRGVPINLGEAFMWATIAATLSAGDGWQTCIDVRDRLAARMTPAQTAAAQNRARGWLAAFERRKK
jgi:TPR repeat protein